jgi:hypothetical protein
VNRIARDGASPSSATARGETAIAIAPELCRPCSLRAMKSSNLLKRTPHVLNQRHISILWLEHARNFNFIFARLSANQHDYRQVL